MVGGYSGIVPAEGDQKDQENMDVSGYGSVGQYIFNFRWNWLESWEGAEIEQR